MSTPDMEVHMTRTLLPLAFLALAACGRSTPEPSGEPAPLDVAVAQVPIEPVEATTAFDAPLTDVESDLAAEVAAVLDTTPEVQTDVADEPAPLTRYALRRGETLAHFARWSGQPVEDVAASSHLDLDGTYAVGTELALQLSDEERSVVEARRDAHHQLRARNYLSSRGSTRTEFYAVRTGDNAWTIARDQLGMPVWMLESLNPSADLDALRPGQELLVPVFEDIVVDAGAAPVVEDDRVDTLPTE